MLIALLALLGVNLIVIVVLLAGVLSRKRWITRQPGAFRGAVRVVDGEVPGLGVKWKRGYGRWVKDILVWTKAPFRSSVSWSRGQGLYQRSMSADMLPILPAAAEPCVTCSTQGPCPSWLRCETTALLVA